MGRNYVLIIITIIISNITVCHGVSKKAPPIVSRFSPGLFAVLQEMLYQPSFALIRLLQKIIQIKQSFSFNLLLAGFAFSAFVYVF